MRGSQDDQGVAWGSDRRGSTVPEHGSPSSGLRTYGLVAGFVLALVATAVVFLTDNPQYLRLAVIAAAWAFVLAAFLAGRRRAEAQASAAREQEIRRSSTASPPRTGSTSSTCAARPRSRCRRS
jgi:hypothetical protein